MFPFILGAPFGAHRLRALPTAPDQDHHRGARPARLVEHGPDAADDPDVVRACYDEITGHMQRALDGLVREMPHPLWARLLTAAGAT